MRISIEKIPAVEAAIETRRLFLGPWLKAAPIKGGLD